MKGPLQAALAGCAVLIGCATLSASILPTLRLNDRAMHVVNDYIANFEKSVYAPFSKSGTLWIDSESEGRKSSFEQGKPLVVARQSGDIEAGSIHHFSGSVRVPGGTINALRNVMRDYSNYPKYFKPDVGTASGKMQPDSSPSDDHFETHLLLTQKTIWFDVAFDTVYDTHYRRLDYNRFASKSVSVSIKELRDPKDPAAGAYPEGDDHGFIWKTNTYWFARERDGGLDLEADSITLSRSVPPGFGWYGTRRAHDAVEKMLRDTKAAVSGALKQ